jgi:hypothetical protein
MLCAIIGRAPGLARGRNKVARSFVADAGVAGESARSLRRILNRSKVGQLVHDDLRLCIEDRCRQRLCIEDVDHDQARAELPKELDVAWRTRRPPDRMAVGQKKRREPPPDHACRARQKDPAHRTR